jgi:hypothetical protein
MCLSEKSREEYRRLARAMDDERLHKLDRYYRIELGAHCDTVDLELLYIVSREIENRRQERVRHLKRAMWLSSRRGRFVEAIKRWLVHRGLWSSARRRANDPFAYEVMPTVSILKPVFWLLGLFPAMSATASIEPELKAPHHP